MSTSSGIATYLLGGVAQTRVVDRAHDVQHELLAVLRLKHHDAVHLRYDLSLSLLLVYTVHVHHRPPGVASDHQAYT